jgi:hypothetical protein
MDDLEASLGILEGDRLLVPGGPLALLGLAPQREATLSWVELLVDKKHLQRIVLVSHQHCLAYRQKLDGSLRDEREIIERDLTRAKRLLESRFHGVRVECWIMPWRETRFGAGYDEAERIIAGPESAIASHGQGHVDMPDRPEL